MLEMRKIGKCLNKPLQGMATTPLLMLTELSGMELSNPVPVPELSRVIPAHPWILVQNGPFLAHPQ